MRPKDEWNGKCTRLSLWRRCFPILLTILSLIAKASPPSSRLIPRVKGYLDSPYGYWEYLPKNYHPSGSYPVVIYLHGIREIGHGETVEELEKVARNGVPLVIRKFERDFPFILIAPQSPAVSEGFASENLERLISIVEKNYGVDEDRIYVTGVSYGAYAVWRLASDIPERLAAIVPFSSCGGDYDIKNLKHVPVWAFGNSGDKQEVPECIEELIYKIRLEGGTPLLTLHPKKGHNAWERTYKNQYMWDWLLKQHRSSKNENQSPILLNPGNKILGVGGMGRFVLMASDRDNDSLIFHVEGPLATGSHFRVRKNGFAELTLNTMMPGLFPVSVTVSDGRGGVSVQHFYLRTSYTLLFLPYVLLLIIQPFIASLPLTSLFVLLMLVQEITAQFIGLLTHFFYWLFICILFTNGLGIPWY